MDVLECINSKRSVRAYADEIISEETMNSLITLGTKASTGSGMEPWGFAILQDKDEINFLSDKSKEYLLHNLDEYPYFRQYESWLKNPGYNIFNNANSVLVIYGNADSHWYVYDCSLAAGNIMLAAHSMGIGTCWIGFAEHILNTEDFKEKHKVPMQYKMVSTLAMGYMKTKLSPPERKKPLIFSR